MTGVVLLGRGGMLGRAFEQCLQQTSATFTAFDRQALDLREQARIDACISEGTRLVINCAAWTDVDGAETQEAAARVVNGASVGRLAERCARVGATLVHFSTDYVFSGDAHVPYAVDAVRQPVNAYGRTKLVGEQLLQASGTSYLLLRTSWLYAPWGKNFVRTLLGLMQTRSEVRVVDDQVGRPTSAESLASATLELVDRNATGTYHVTDGGQCSWFELTQAIKQQAGLQCRVLPCKTSEFPRPAKRPAYSVLGLEKTEAVLGPRPHWSLPLGRVLAALGASTNLLVVLLVSFGLSACGSEEAAAALPEASGVELDARLVDLDAADTHTLCAWAAKRASAVTCSDGSKAVHGVPKSDECVEQWPRDTCAGTVAEFEGCLTTDPCDAVAVLEACVPLVSCEFGSSDANFLCANGLSQVAREAVCDGIDDCPDSSDEGDCGEL